MSYHNKKGGFIDFSALANKASEHASNLHKTATDYASGVSKPDVNALKSQPTTHANNMDQKYGSQASNHANNMDQKYGSQASSHANNMDQGAKDARAKYMPQSSMQSQPIQSNVGQMGGRRRRTKHRRSKQRKTKRKHNKTKKTRKSKRRSRKH